MTNHVYSCSYCGETITQDSVPKQSGCSCKSSHNWIRLGEEGINNYQCRDCKLEVKTKYSPQQTGCTKASSHYWKKL